MLFLKRLFKAPQFQAEGRVLFRQIAEHARLPVFYTRFGVPDTIDGRFEMLCIHAYGVFRRLKGQGDQSDALAQAVYDAMFEELDGALREMGVADLGVGRRIKIMTEALNGRIQAFDQALATGEEALRDAVRRNVYGTVSASDVQVAEMADYLREVGNALAHTSIESLHAARLTLPSPRAATVSEAADAIG